jgi:VIT1/CCC1 family predicted Fe2+/Mn2+ transporter
MSALTGRSAWLSGGRMLVIGGGLAAITYGVGTLLHVAGAVG